MNHDRTAHEKTRRLTALALLTALVVVLQTVASGIRIGPIPISLTLVPIVIGAILYGRIAGAYLGFVFGVVTLAAGMTGADGFTFMLFSASPFWTAVTCLAKGALCGYVPAVVYRGLTNCGKRRMTAGCVCASLLAPLVNTGVFALAMLTVLRGSLDSFAASQGTADAVWFLFMTMIGTNFLVELGINAVLSTVVTRVVQTIGTLFS